MSRVWKETIPPKMLHDQFGIYQGVWMPQMDRCWNSDDGFQVMSRLLITDWGKVEHATISRIHSIVDGDFPTSDGSDDIPWALKQEIKNELFGENRVAVEVFPTEDKKVDVMDIYHLWVFPKNYSLPFGIHPTKDKQCRVVNRGCPKDATRLVANSKEMLGISDE